MAQPPTLQVPVKFAYDPDALNTLRATIQATLEAQERLTEATKAALDLIEALRGAETPQADPGHIVVHCQACAGTGLALDPPEGQPDACLTCAGHGVVQTPYATGLPEPTTQAGGPIPLVADGPEQTGGIRPCGSDFRHDAHPYVLAGSGGAPGSVSTYSRWCLGVEAGPVPAQRGPAMAEKRCGAMGEHPPHDWESHDHYAGYLATFYCDGAGA